MNKLLLLELPLSGDEPLKWLYWQDDAAVDSGALTAEQLPELAQRYADIPCYAIIDGQAVSHHRIVLPKGGRIGLAALPYQLEERLCTDLASVHYAHGSIRANEPVDVLVIDRKLMQRSFDLLSDCGLSLKGMLPDYGVLPNNAIILDDKRASVHLQHIAAGLDTGNFPVWWQLAAGEETVNPTLYTASDWSEPIALPNSPTRHFQQRLEALAQCFQPWSLNLLSGAFAIRDERKMALQGLRWPVVLLALALLLHWASLAVTRYTANAKADRLDVAMEELYLETFPGSRVVNPRSQMRSQLNALAGGSVQQSRLLPWLEKVAAASRQQQGVALSQIAYEDDPAVMKLQVQAESFEVVDAWVAALSGQGVSVSRGAFNQEAAGIGGQVILRGEE